MEIIIDNYFGKENYVAEELADAQQYYQKMEKAIKSNNAKGFIVSVEDLKNNEHRLFKIFFDYYKYKKDKIGKIKSDFSEFMKAAKPHSNFFDFIRQGKHQKINQFE